MSLGVPGRLRPRIFSTFGTTRVVGRQPYSPAAFTPGEIPGTHFQRLSRPQGTWFCRKEPRKKSQVTPLGIDPATVQLVSQRLNHYAMEYVILLTFPLLQWLHERTSMLRYTYFACHVPACSPLYTLDIISHLNVGARFPKAVNICFHPYFELEVFHPEVFVK